jgi:hypothetical protein
MTYEDLKKWFAENDRELPESLGTKWIHIADVRRSVRINIEDVEREKLRFGKAIGNSRIAGAAKARMTTIFELLKNQQNHNQKGLPENIFSSRRKQN